MQALGWLCFHQALAGSHRAWTFAVLQTPRGALGRSLGPRWCFVIPVRHGGCTAGPLHLHTGGVGWEPRHGATPVCPLPQTSTAHRAMRCTSSGVSEAAPCFVGWEDSQTLPVSLAQVALGGDGSTALPMGPIRQTFFRPWMHFWCHCWAVVNSEFLTPVLIHQQHLSKQ